MNKNKMNNPDVIHLQEQGGDRFDKICRWYIRIFALYVIFEGIYYWIILIGISGEAGGVSTMLQPDAFLICALSIGLPIAGAGLWLLGPWGAILFLALTILQGILIYLGVVSSIFSVFIVFFNAILVIVHYILGIVRVRLSKPAKFS